jgi:hypothetical protein
VKFAVLAEAGVVHENVYRQALLLGKFINGFGSGWLRQVRHIDF